MLKMLMMLQLKDLLLISMGALLLLTKRCFKFKESDVAFVVS
jgi:hypothetical protein